MSVADAMNRDKTLITKFATVMQWLASEPGGSLQCVVPHSDPGRPNAILQNVDIAKTRQRCCVVSLQG